MRVGEAGRRYNTPACARRTRSTPGATPQSDRCPLGAVRFEQRYGAGFVTQDRLMRTRNTRLVSRGVMLLAAAVALGSSCSRERGHDAGPVPRAIACPAPPGAGEPNLSTQAGRVF